VRTATTKNFKNGVKTLKRPSKTLNLSVLHCDGSDPMLLAIAISVTDNGHGAMLHLGTEPRWSLQKSIWGNYDEDIRLWVFCSNIYEFYFLTMPPMKMYHLDSSTTAPIPG
jgi:hypothetical protein